LVGFGRSDKPAHREDYTFAAHVDWTWSAIEAIGLDAITLVCQDWGGLIGLRMVGEHGDRFARVVAANTFLPNGDRPPGEAFLAWQKYSQETSDLKVGQIVNGGCLSELTAGQIAAYDAPFPDDTFKAGARQFPTLVPTTPDDPRPRPIAPHGTDYAVSIGRFCVRSPTPTPSPPAPIGYCALKSLALEPTIRSPLSAPRTSCRRTRVPNWLK
jgi:pimeloyl-ACP methyl ester carboxylesterase